MDTFNSIINWLLQSYFAALAWAPPGAGLALLAILLGAGMLWVFRRTSDQARIRAVKRRLQAHLLELRIFGDEPGVVWRAQKSLLAANLRYIGLMLRPALWMALPLTLILVHLEAFYGRAPLPVGRETVVTMAMRSPLDARTPAPVLVTPSSIVIETPPVRVLDERQISWRIRPLAAASGDLRFTVDGDTIEKRVEAGSGLRFVPGRRTSGVFAALWHPDERRIKSPAVDWIDLHYPEATVVLLGIRMHWLLWFTVISMLTALLLKRRFRVVL